MRGKNSRTAVFDHAVEEEKKPENDRFAV